MPAAVEDQLFPYLRAFKDKASGPNTIEYKVGEIFGEIGRSLGKTNPLNDDDLAEFVKLQKGKADSAKSWTVDAKGIDQETFDLAVKNPNGNTEVVHRSPKQILDEIAALDAESAKVLRKIKELL